MQFLQAITSIEKKVEAIHIRWPDGSAMHPIEALAVVGQFHGERYNSCLDCLAEGEFTVAEYYLEMIRMITEYSARDRGEG